MPPLETGGHDLLDVKAFAIIFDDGKKMIFASDKDKAQVGGLSMFDDIGEGFLDEAINGGFKFRGEPLFFQAAAMKIDGDAGAARPFIDIVDEHRMEPEIVQSGGSQLKGNPMDLLAD